MATTIDTEHWSIDRVVPPLTQNASSLWYRYLQAQWALVGGCETYKNKL